jgi:methylase of polypeptide subunit release factors
LLENLAHADALEEDRGRLRSRVRFSTIGKQLFVHAGFPTTTNDAVFFGPDTYRFVCAIDQVLAFQKGPTVVIDIGAGSGAGGIHVAYHFPHSRIILTDVNERALRFATINARLNNVEVEVRRSDVLSNVTERADLIVCNPPYLIDAERRLYRHGGGEWGCDLAARMLREGLDKLTPTGTFLLYSGAPIVGGHDMLFRELLPRLKDATTHFQYEEMDPDVFGEELEGPAYSEADRIAVIRLVVNASDLRVHVHAS